MKRILLLFVTLLTLCGCSGVGELPTNDTVSLSFKLKDNREYIMVDQYDDIDSIDFLPYLDISSNKELEYTIKWVGQGLSHSYRTYDSVLNSTVFVDEWDTKTQRVDEDFIRKDKENTLKCDGFVPITIYLETEFNGEKISRNLNTLLLIVPEDYQTEFLHSIDGESIEEVYRLLYEHDTSTPKCYGGMCGAYSAREVWNEKGYATNMRGN